jgi:hypothetical protein
MTHTNKHRHKIESGSLKALSILTIGLGAILAIKSPAIADSYIAQVGVRGSINRPTSLNITPPSGTHIPLPESNYHNRGYYYHDHSYDRYDDRYDDDYHSHGRRYPRPGGTVIIINPPVYETPRTEEKTYIRVIRTN